MERQWRPNAEPSPACPRCGSSNTKFCYYNNYSLSQPRFFCRACRRYWTKGGSLRNVPIGGGCRRKKSMKFCLVLTGRRTRSSVSGLGGPTSHTSLPAVHHNNNNNNNNGSEPVSEVSTATIDLAAVFANLVNPGPRAEQDSNHVPLLLIPDFADGIGIVNPPVEISGSYSHFGPYLPQESKFLGRREDSGFSGRLNDEPQPFLGVRNGFMNSLNNGIVENSVVLLPFPGHEDGVVPSRAEMFWSPDGSDVVSHGNQMMSRARNHDFGPGEAENNMAGLDGNVRPLSPLINVDAIFRS